ncbi:MAG TPA: gamma-glutamyltransferase [Gemmatimonadales bacterium]|nr:gamma-glutamyltransferase [Gemmatimonadales bacterium]
MSRYRSLLAVASLVAAACRGASPAPAPTPAAAPAGTPAAAARSAFPEGWTYPARARRLAVPQAAVAAGNVIASEVGRNVLRQGGNAVDAAVATGFAMAVVDPEAGNIGGGGFMLIRRASGESFLIDYRERAPGAARRDMYIGPDGEPTDKSRIGHLAAGVPGSVAGLLEAHRRFGRLPLTTLIEPAIRLARDGFILDSIRSARIRSDSAKLAQFPASVKIFLPGGRVPDAGERLVQQDLARTLTTIRDKGADGFYRGWVADSIVAEMQRGGGLITHADLAAYEPIWRDPVAMRYRGHTVLGAPPVASGGVSLGMMLNMLQAGGPVPAFGSAAMLHLYAETMRRAFVMRNRHVADPAYHDVPLAWLLTTQVGDSLRRTIDPAHATPTPAIASPGTGSTTHYSVVDAEGMAVATTTTINDLYGCGVTVSGAGFLLNDEMDDFSTAPDRPNSWGLVQATPNEVEPGKRPLSNMTPTIVLDPEGEVLLVLGSRGGPTIITQVLQVVVNVIDHRMDLVNAVGAPRVHHQATPDRLNVDRGGFTPAAIDSLRAMGHEIREQNPGGDIEAIMRTAGGWIAVSDPRSGGGPAGY